MVAGPSQPHLQAQRNPFANGTPTHAPSETAPRSSGPEALDEHDDTLSEVIMAVDLTPRGTVGCCYYVARDEKLYFMEDIQFGDVDVIDARRFALPPNFGQT
jgi:DNA mismatch repair protein MSH5